MVIHKPYALDKNLGKAYNDCIRQLNDKWVILMDIDTMFLTPTQPRMIQEYIDLYGDREEIGMFTCFTNRVGYKSHLPGRVIDDNDSIKYHIHKAKLHDLINSREITKMPKQLSGFFMCIRRSAWASIGGFKEGAQLLGVDDDFTTRLCDAGYDIYRMDNLYVWHSYRIDTHKGNTEHLTV